MNLALELDTDQTFQLAAALRSRYGVLLERRATVLAGPFKSGEALASTEANLIAVGDLTFNLTQAERRARLEPLR
jgi:hypothetical protein